MLSAPRHPTLLVASQDEAADAVGDALDRRADAERPPLGDERRCDRAFAGQEPMDRLRYRETVSPGCRQVGGGVDEHVDAVEVASFERRRGEGPFGDVNEGVSARHVALAVSEQPVACFAKGVVHAHVRGQGRARRGGGSGRGGRTRWRRNRWVSQVRLGQMAAWRLSPRRVVGRRSTAAPARPSSRRRGPGRSRRPPLDQAIAGRRRTPR